MPPQREKQKLRKICNFRFRTVNFMDSRPGHWR